MQYKLLMENWRKFLNESLDPTSKNLVEQELRPRQKRSYVRIPSKRGLPRGPSMKAAAGHAAWRKKKDEIIENAQIRIHAYEEDLKGSLNKVSFVDNFTGHSLSKHLEGVIGIYYLKQKHVFLDFIENKVGINAWQIWEDSKLDKKHPAPRDHRVGTVEISLAETKKLFLRTHQACLKRRISTEYAEQDATDFLSSLIVHELAHATDNMSGSFLKKLERETESELQTLIDDGVVHNQSTADDLETASDFVNASLEWMKEFFIYLCEAYAYKRQLRYLNKLKKEKRDELDLTQIGSPGHMFLDKTIGRVGRLKYNNLNKHLRKIKKLR